MDTLPKINISTFYRWDLRLKKSESFFKCCEDFLYENLISTIRFTTSGEITSSVFWEEAIADANNICDFNLTGYDNGFLYNFSSEVISLNDLHFKMYPVSGTTYCYNYGIDAESGFTYTSLNGGFFEGFYKLEGYDYQVLPAYYPDGVSFEIIFRKKTTMEDGCELPLLNSLNENNNNFIFYIGTRAINKFCNLNEAEIGQLTCDLGDSWFDEYEVTQRKIFENSFLYYNNESVCEFSGYSYDVTLPTCCDDLIDNCFGVRFTSGNSINVRVITTTGSCVSDKWEDNIVVNNYYSDPAAFNDNEWVHMVIRFEPTSYNECDLFNYGSLSIFINGKRQLLLKNIKELKPKALSTIGAKQLGVPYNISVGGAVQGLLESVDVGGHDDSYFSGDTLCNYYLKIKDCFSLKGAIVNGIEYYADDLIESDDVDAIRLFLLSVTPNRYGNIVVERKGFGGYLETYITINYCKDSVESLILTDGVYKKPYDTKCFEVPEHILECVILENYFAGTFIGDIYSFNIYDRALPIQEIVCYLKTYDFIH